MGRGPESLQQQLRKQLQREKGTRKPVNGERAGANGSSYSRIQMESQLNGESDKSGEDPEVSADIDDVVSQTGFTNRAVVERAICRKKDRVNPQNKANFINSVLHYSGEYGLATLNAHLDESCLAAKSGKISKPKLEKKLQEARESGVTFY